MSCILSLSHLFFSLYLFLSLFCSFSLFLSLFHSLSLPPHPSEQQSGGGSRPVLVQVAESAYRFMLGSVAGGEWLHRGLGAEGLRSLGASDQPARQPASRSRIIVHHPCTCLHKPSTTTTHPPSPQLPLQGDDTKASLLPAGVERGLGGGVGLGGGNFPASPLPWGVECYLFWMEREKRLCVQIPNPKLYVPVFVQSGEKKIIVGGQF